jgi:hypothetical protein
MATPPSGMAAGVVSRNARSGILDRVMISSARLLGGSGNDRPPRWPIGETEGEAGVHCDDIRHETQFNSSPRSPHLPRGCASAMARPIIVLTTFAFRKHQAYCASLLTPGCSSDWMLGMKIARVSGGPPYACSITCHLCNYNFDMGRN